MIYQNVLFDLDNTLLDFDQSSRLAWTDVMAHYRLPTSDTHYQLYHQINQRLWSTLETGALHQDEIKHRRWSDYFAAIDTYRDPIQSNQLYFDGLSNHVIKIAGADDLLSSLADRKIGIVTNGIGVVQRRRLASTGWLDRIQHIVISDEIGVAKPHRAYFDHTFEVMSIPNNQKQATIIVGDTLKSDIKGGIDYGIDTCWHNYTGKELRGPYEPTMTVDSLTELLDNLA